MQCFIKSNTIEKQSLIPPCNPGQNTAYKSQLASQSSQKTKSRKRFYPETVSTSFSYFSFCPIVFQMVFSKSLHTLNLQVAKPELIKHFSYMLEIYIKRKFCDIKYTLQKKQIVLRTREVFSIRN